MPPPAVRPPGASKHRASKQPSRADVVGRPHVQPHLCARRSPRCALMLPGRLFRASLRRLPAWRRANGQQEAAPAPSPWTCAVRCHLISREHGGSIAAVCHAKPDRLPCGGSRWPDRGYCQSTSKHAKGAGLFPPLPCHVSCSPPSADHQID